MTRTMTASCQRAPTIIIFSGIMSRTVSRSSKIASTLAFRNSQVADSPAAASIENRIPAEVGAANLPASREFDHADQVQCSAAGCMANTNHAAQKIHGNAAAV